MFQGFYLRTPMNIRSAILSEQSQKVRNITLNMKSCDMEWKTDKFCRLGTLVELYNIMATHVGGRVATTFANEKIGKKKANEYSILA